MAENIGEAAAVQNCLNRRGGNAVLPFFHTGMSSRATMASRWDLDRNSDMWPWISIGLDRGDDAAPEKIWRDSLRADASTQEYAGAALGGAGYGSPKGTLGGGDGPGKKMGPVVSFVDGSPPPLVDVRIADPASSSVTRPPGSILSMDLNAPAESMMPLSSAQPDDVDAFVCFDGLDDNGGTVQVLDGEPVSDTMPPSEEGLIIEHETAPGWEQRPRIGEMDDSYAETTLHPTALEKALKNYAIRRQGLVVEPRVGTVFDSMAEAYEFYNLYSWEIGFGIRYGRCKRNKFKSKTVQNIVCACADKPANANGNSIRSECQAKIKIARRKNGVWYIKEHRAEHNHPLSETCAEKQHWKSHRHIDNYTKQLIKHLRDSNVSLTKVFTIISTFFGNLGNAPFTKRSVRTLCAKFAKENADDDVRKTIELFHEIKKEDPAFTYNVLVDEGCQIKALIWTTGRSRMQYEWFEDVVTFDTTYKTNLYKMPFGLFVGVNNHFQSIVFAGVLMRNETIRSFKWVFSEFVRLMGGKAPQTILTDQCKAMEEAIKQVLPNITHRWCKWHVLRKAKESIGPAYSKRCGFKQEFHKILNSMLTESEAAWKQLLEKYNLTDNNFLNQIYDNRQRWAKPYFKGKFCAKQTSTQRSESANNMLKKYVSTGSPMHSFVQQYQRLQFDRDAEESYEERMTKLAGKQIVYNPPIEWHAAKVYTRKMFAIFSEQIFNSGCFIAEEKIKKTKYVVKRFCPEQCEKWEQVEFQVDAVGNGDQYICQCGLAEHMGMLCPHIIRVFIQFGIDKIPEKHIIKRWTVNARDMLPAQLAHYQKDKAAIQSQTFRHNALYTTALELVDLGDSNPNAYEIAMKHMLQAKEEIQEAASTRDGLSLVEQLERNNQADDEQSEVLNDTGIQVVHMDTAAIQPPERIKKRGRPPLARDKPPYERSAKRVRTVSASRKINNALTLPSTATKKQPTCSRCNLKGHNRTQCNFPPPDEFAPALLHFGPGTQQDMQSEPLLFL
ncbi:hypothetical protein ACP70R_011022 [Stipagrostis hirtigluma subsp. patula]